MYKWPLVGTNGAAPFVPTFIFWVYLVKVGTNGAAPFVPTCVLSKKVGTLVAALILIYLKKQTGFW